MRNCIKNLAAFIFILNLIFLSSGCSVFQRAETPDYYIGEAAYLELVPLCKSQGIGIQYDTITRKVKLTNKLHAAYLMLQDTMVLFDNVPLNLANPVDIQDGAIVVPLEFKNKIIDKF